MAITIACRRSGTANPPQDKYVFVRHVEQTENIVIMGPSETQLVQCEDGVYKLDLGAYDCDRLDVRGRAEDKVKVHFS